MFYLIGIGRRKEDITEEMKDVISRCDSVFLEFYTSFYENSVNELESALKTSLIRAPREVVESQAEEKMIEPGKTKDIALLVMGDPLVATTHVDILQRARDAGVATQVFHNVSIANFITRTGLQFYKFGKITSIPFFSAKYMPRTPYMTLIDNARMGAHSLFLLDLKPDEGTYLKAHEALDFLLEIPQLMVDQEEIEEQESNMIDGNSDAIICSQLGFSDEVILFGTINELLRYDREANLPAPICVIIPGDYHEMELQHLEQFRLQDSQAGHQEDDEEEP